MFTHCPVVKRLLAALCVINALSVSLSAAPAKEAEPIQVEAPGAAFEGEPAWEELEPTRFGEWFDGREIMIGNHDEGRSPEWVVWTTNKMPGHSGLHYGLSDTPGPRHLRVGFSSPREVGTVMVQGGGSLSVLKANATLPVNLANESQWLPAQRLLPDGTLTSDPVLKGEYALWILPPNTITKELRFTTIAEASDATYEGWLGSALVTKERLINQAPYATVVSRSNARYADKLNNGLHDGWGVWENREVRGSISDDEPPISPDNAEWIIMAWNDPVKVDALGLLWAGVGAVEVQTYTGPASIHPRDAKETDWQSVAAFESIQHGYSKQLWPNRLNFGKEITTRALRIRITAVNPDESHGHIKGHMLDGRRVWMGEVWALRSIASSPLKPIKMADAKSTVPHPPIPIKFNIGSPGFVTLVIERPDGTRVRNLISETWFPAGENTAWWDGTDDLGRDTDAAEHGIYRIPARFVEPGEYRVRGLVRGAITPSYEFSVYTTGNPPWSTADHTGGWLANHSPPMAAAFVPASKSPTREPAVYLGCYVTEGPDGMAWVDLDGRKRGGKKWIGGNWTAAPYIACDVGKDARSGVSVYVASVWETEKKSGIYELRITAVGSGRDQPVLVSELDDLPATTGKLIEVDGSEGHLSGLAVHNGIAVVSLPSRNQLVFVKAVGGEVLGQVTLDQPRGLSFDSRGRLLAVSGNRVVRFASINNVASIARPEVVVSAGLDDPVALTLDAQGQIYVSDRGESHQVKVFSDSGKLVGLIGHAGKPKAGPYDPLHMNNPAGIAIDSKNQLWVTEHDYLPKRVSVWTLDGNLVNAFYGPGKYGGGGTLDSTDQSLFYYAESSGAMEFKLDWSLGTYSLTNVYYRPGPGDMQLAFRSAGPESEIRIKDRRYFTNVYNSSPTGGHNTAFLFLEEKGVARPIAAMGRATDWDLLKDDAFRPIWPAGTDLAAKDTHRNPAFFIWNDLNGDAHAQPAEVTITNVSGTGITIMDDLSFCVARLGDQTMHFTPVSVDRDGYPRYDIKAGKILASGVQPPGSSGGNQALTTADGWTSVTLGIEPFARYSLSGSKDGVAKWSYPNMWPGLHASHSAPPPDHPGELIGPTRLLGGFMKSRIGPLWAINSNHGCVYVFTSDGLFVATIFEDMRQGKRWQMPLAERGMSLAGFTLGDENFWPSITQLPDGTVYLVDGSRSSLVRLDGMNNLSRLPESKLMLTSADLDRSRLYQVQVEAARQQAQGSGVLTVLGRFTPPVVDGKLEDWPTTNWVDIDKRGVRAYFNSNSKPYDVTGSVSVSGGKLYAAWKAGDPKLLENSGELPTALFKTGGALDIMIGANPKADPTRIAPVNGDIRLLVSMVDQKPRALLYRPVAPGARVADRVPFSSPWRTIVFDRVDDVTDQIEFATADGNYEISVPLDLLLLKPTADMEIKGDIGILRGQGNLTSARIYWANKATGITADVPSEAMLTPSLWGNWLFKSE